MAIINPNVGTVNNYSSSFIELGQNVPIFHSGSRTYLSMESYFWLISCSLQNIKNGDGLCPKLNVLFKMAKK